MRDYFAFIKSEVVTCVTSSNNTLKPKEITALKGEDKVTHLPTNTCDTCDESLVSQPVTTKMDKGVIRKMREYKASHIVTPVTPWNKLYEERAAIMEYDAGMKREEAERLSYQEVLVEFLTRYYPATKAEFDAIIHCKRGDHE